MSATAEPAPVRWTASEEERRALARMLMQLFEHWQLDTADQLSLLGLAPDNRAALTRYRNGSPLANQRDLLDRAATLLGIHKNLRLLFPNDRDLAYRWISTRNRAFDQRTPVEVIREWGFAGMLMVRAYLDRARGR